MTVDELINLTASLSSGKAGEKKFHKIIRGSKGKFGVQLIADVTELERAISEGAYTFTGKDGHKNVALNPKVWPPKEGKIVNREVKKEESFIGDDLPPF